jgi:beta-glucosidase
VLAVAKHFILNNQETNRFTLNVIADSRTLWEMYYPPFQAAVDAGAAGFMCSYNLVNGEHACGNSDALLRDLKKDMGFNGWVQSDWWALHSFAAPDGVDQEMPGTPIEGQPVWFTNENLDTLSEEKVDDMVRRQPTPMVENGLFEAANHACTPPDCEYELYEANATNAERQALSKALAHKAVMLLKNGWVGKTGKKALPLSSDVAKIALLGEACNASQDVAAQLAKWDLGSYYNMGGSGRVIAWNPETIYDGIKARAGADISIQTYFGGNSDDAVAIAHGADVAILCGGTSSTEHHDRSSLDIDQQDFLVETSESLKKGNMPVVVLTMTPVAVVMPWLDNTDAAVNLFLAGRYTGSAFASALFGDSNPSAN